MGIDKDKESLEINKRDQSDVGRAHLRSEPRDPSSKSKLAAVFHKRNKRGRKRRVSGRNIRSLEGSNENSRNTRVFSVLINTSMCEYAMPVWAGEMLSTNAFQKHLAYFRSF